MICAIMDDDDVDFRLLTDALERVGALEVRGHPTAPSRDARAIDVIYADARDARSLLTAFRPRADGTTAVVVAMSAFAPDAVRAFDVGAVDFLLKPFTQARVALSVRRAGRIVESRYLTRITDRWGAEREDEVDGLLMSAIRHSLKALGVTRRASRGQSLAVSDIYAATTKGDRCQLFTALGTLDSHLSMSALQATLGAEFVRTHRATRVNRCCIHTLSRLDGGGGRIQLPDGRLMPVSKSRMSVVRAIARLAAQ